MKDEEMDKFIKEKLNDKFEVPNKIQMDVQRILRNLEQEESKKKTSPVIKFFKAVATGIAATVILSAVSLTVYAAAGGDLSNIPLLERLGLKFGEKFNELKEDILDVEVFENGVRLKLENVACDSSTMILKYNLKIEEPICSAFRPTVAQNGEVYDESHEINLSEVTDITLTTDFLGIKINGEGNTNLMPVTITEKIWDNEYTIYEIYNFMGIEIPNEFIVDMRFSGIYFFDDDYINFGPEIKFNVSKEKGEQLTSITLPENNTIVSDNRKTTVSKIIKAPFKTFIVVDVETYNINSELLDMNPFYELDSANNYGMMLLDENDNSLKYETYGISKKVVTSDGRTIQYEGYYGMTLEDREGKPRQEYTRGTLYTRMVLALDDMEKAEEIKIQAFVTRFYNERTNEELEYMDTLKYYPLKDGAYSESTALGGKITINKIEITDEKILFHYTEEGMLTGWENIAIMRDDKTYPGHTIMLYPDIVKWNNPDIPDGVVGFNRINNRSAGDYYLGKNEILDTDTLFVSLDNLEFTLFIEPRTKLEGNPIIINLNSNNNKLENEKNDITNEIVNNVIDNSNTVINNTTTNNAIETSSNITNSNIIDNTFNIVTTNTEKNIVEVVEVTNTVTNNIV